MSDTFDSDELVDLYPPERVAKKLCLDCKREFITPGRRCDGCWELRSRIQNQPQLAAKILAEILDKK